MHCTMWWMCTSTDCFLILYERKLILFCLWSMCILVCVVHMPLLFKTFPSKSPLLMYVMLMCVILFDTHFHASLPWWHNLYLDCQLTCNQILFLCHEICHLNLFLLSLFISLSLLFPHKLAHTLKGMNPTALTQGRYELWRRQLCIRSSRDVCVCVRAYTGWMNQDFLGTLIFISNSSLERCLKADSLSATWENPSQECCWT